MKGEAGVLTTGVVARYPYQMDVHAGKAADRIPPEHLARFFSHASTLQAEFVRLVEFCLERYSIDLRTYRLVFDHRPTTRLGQCRYGRKEVAVSWFAVLDVRKAQDTLRHEVAHAAAYAHTKARGHGKVWKFWARRLGADPTRCGTVDGEAAAVRAEAAPPKWTLTCTRCGATIHRRRLSRRFFEGEVRHGGGCGPMEISKNEDWLEVRQ